MVREIIYLIEDVRKQTDNNDTNGVKDKEIIRYFQDGIRSIQAIIFKNNPLCAYLQDSEEYPANTAREFALPSDCYADNAVSMVEVQGAGNCWSVLNRVWPEDHFFGWYTRNKKVVLSGDEAQAFPQAIKVSYFKRLARFDKVWATVASVAGQVVTLSNVDADFGLVDRYCSFVTAAGVEKLPGLKIASYTSTTITFPAGVDVSSLVLGDQLLMGANVSLTLDLPEEVESYLMDYVAKRVYARNNYSLEGSKIDLFNAEEKDNIAAIFGDASQAITRTPITDTSYLRI